MDKELIEMYFEYKNGGLYWKIDKPNSKYKKGDKAGCIYSNGYYVIKFNNKRYLEHRLIYTLFKSEIEKNFMIDHIDQNKLNNNIENLRSVDRGINRMNSDKSKNIKIINGKYYGIFTRNKKNKMKAFSSEIDAKDWVLKMKQEVFNALGE
jgi:hypothetical protein